MKKYLLTAALLVASVSAFGQGYFLMVASKGATTDGFTTPGTVSLSSGTVNVGFLWGSTGTPAIITLAGSTGNNGGSPTNTPSYSPPPGAWNAILNDPNYTLAVNGNTAALVVTPSNTSSLAKGGYAYNSSATFPVTGTASGNSYTLVAIAWDKNFATPAAAAAANAAVGWSNPFTYAAVNNIGTPANFTASGVGQFGVYPVPEPATLALAGLGAASLLLFRRKK